jgi:hypothetical protein
LGSGPAWGATSAANDLQSCPTKSSATEFMQYRSPVGGGPSPKTWPRCASQRRQATSVLVIPPEASSFSSTLSSETGDQKLGHPVPESNSAPELKRRLPQQTHLYMPLHPDSRFLPEKGRSVPFPLVTLYCSGVRMRRHSRSVLFTLSDMLLNSISSRLNCGRSPNAAGFAVHTPQL